MSMVIEADYIVLGAGMYGLYASQLLVEKGYKTVVLEHDDDSFMRASFINQARVHRGYHYPRSYATAIKSAAYFKEFYKDFDFAILSKLTKIYGIAKHYSLTGGKQFKSFCEKASIPCKEVSTKDYYKTHLVEQAFLTEEYVLDAKRIKGYFLEKLEASKRCAMYYHIRLKEVAIKGSKYIIKTEDGHVFIAPKIINTTYASVNQVLKKFHVEPFPIRYEISEIILCQVKDVYKDLGLTLMDGPFFSIMPFGFSGYHSLTSVTFTHHKTCYESLPRFQCQEGNPACTPDQLDNCNLCQSRPKSFYVSMKQMANKYLAMDMGIRYKESLFAIKPLLETSKMDDSRPTVIKIDDHGERGPTLMTVLSGKINTAYDLKKVIE